MICRVAIIDSGINEFYDDKIFNKYSCVGGDYYDYNGHGTKCVSIIEKIAPDTEFTVIKLLNENLQCSVHYLYEALTFMLDMDIDIINLSLSTANLSQFQKIDNVCKELHRQGKILVSSKANNGEVSYPAESKYVVGVSGNLFNTNEEFWYKEILPIQCVGSKTPSIVKVSNDKYAFFSGNSKATACITGILSKNWERLCFHPIAEKYSIISSLANRNNWNDQDIISDIIPNKDKNQYINEDSLILIERIFKKFLDINIKELSDSKFLFEYFKLSEIEIVVNKLFQEFDISYTESELNLYDFMRVEDLCMKISSMLK